MNNYTSLVIGNWKMNGNSKVATSLACEILAKFSSFNTNVVLCPPYIYLPVVSRIINGSCISLGSQNCSSSVKGAYTGEVSASMLKDIGCSYVILGHSERRNILNERDHEVRKKSDLALQNNLTPVVCIGESLDHYNSGETFSFLMSQMNDSLPKNLDGKYLVVAYEPIWSIGTGKILSSAKLEVTHDFIRLCLISYYGDTGKQIPVLYGGSVNPNNASNFTSIKNVNGFLVGGSSLDSDSFLDIISKLD